MPTIPNGLKPVVDGYRFDGPSGSMQTEVSGGASRFALDYDRGPQQFSVTLIMDAVQFSVWTAFFHHAIKQGTISFDMPIDSGFGSSMHACNIIPGSYSAARTGGIMTVVSFVVQATSQVYDMTESEAQVMVDVYNIYGQETGAFLARLAKFATVDALVLQDL